MRYNIKVRINGKDVGTTQVELDVADACEDAVNFAYSRLELIATEVPPCDVCGGTGSIYIMRTMEPGFNRYDCAFCKR